MQNEIAGFWRRVGAIFIDAIILGALGLVLGFFFSQQFVELGGWGRAVGFPIAAIYFVVLNSRMGKGQTLGKRILKIQVVGNDGQLLNIPKSTVRYAVIAAPYFLNGAQMSEAILTSFWTHLLSLFIFGFGLSIIYFILFNRNTRQSLHDLVAGTFVVRLNIERESAIKSVWSIHYGVCGVLLIASLLLPILTGEIAKSETFAELLNTRKEIQSVPQVVFATITDGTSTFRSTGGVKSTTTYINTQVFLRTNTIDDDALAKNIADIILRTHKEARQRNVIQVILTYGYDIGISSFWKRFRFKFSPEQWQDMTDQDVKQGIEA